MDSTEEIKATIDKFFHAMDTQNLALMEELISKKETTIHIGTNEDEVWKGWKVLSEATKKQFDGLEYYKANIRDLTVNFSESGDTAWYFHLLDTEIKSRGNITRWKGARFTGVLEKQNGRWVMAQTHVSIPESA